MKVLTVKKLQETFVGKVCTILTVSLNKTNFQDQQFADFFSGIVLSLDEDGLFLKHLVTSCRSFFTWPHIVSIMEEQVIQEDDPAYQQIIEEVKKAPVDNQKTIVPVSPNSPFIDADAMATLVAQAKDVQSTMLRKQP